MSVAGRADAVHRIAYALAVDFTYAFVSLEIALTWDGEPVPADEVAMVSVANTGPEAPAGSLIVRVDAPFHGDPAPPGAPGPTPGLWEFEVVELFIAESGADSAPDSPLNDEVRYLEIELSPHGHHLVLRLRAVRQVVEQGLELEYRAEIDASTGRWTGEAVVPGAWLPPAPHRVNAFAIHRQGNGRRYLAWSPLPGPKPDFHQPARFPLVALVRQNLARDQDVNDE